MNDPRGLLRSRALPWLLALVFCWAVLHGMDVPHTAIASYAGYFGGCVVLPGVLLLRLLWRSTGNWAEDAALGAAAGLVAELAGWALFTALGIQRALVVWPVLVLLCFAVVPGLRRYWRIDRPAPLPVLWSWAAAAAICWAIWYLLGWAGASPAPPDGTAYYQDMLYHLSLVHELVREIPPELPQVAGEPLQYHWLPDAHLAAAVDVTGQSPERVLFRLWLPPVVAAGLVTFAALARLLSRTWWAGPVALAMTAFVQWVDLWRTPAGLSLNVFEYLSPSQTVGVLLGTAAAVVLVDVLFGRTRRRAWLLVAALALAGGGAKPTTLPLLLGGTVLAAVYVLARDRQLPWRIRRLPRRVLVASGLLVATAVVTTLTLTGSTGGSRLQLFSMARFAPGYAAATGDRSMAALGGWILTAIRSGDGVAVVGGWVLVGTMLISQLAAVAGLAVLLARTTRRDPAAWWLAGALGAGWLAFLLVDHPAASQGYFVRSALPFSAAGTAWLVAAALRGRSRRTMAITAATALGVGCALVLLPRLVSIAPDGSRPGQIRALGLPMIAFAVLVAAAVAGWFVARRRLPRLAGLGVAVTVLAVAAASVPNTIAGGADLVTAGRFPPGPVLRVAGLSLSGPEQRAAYWLREHSGTDDVVVTNTACLPPRRQPPGCDARGYLVSGLAGRRTLLEGWAYSQQALVRHGAGGLRYSRQPSPWPDRSALTRQVFTAPTPALLRRLRTEYGVRWVYADGQAGPVSPRLAVLADLRHTDGPVRVYELRPE